MLPTDTGNTVFCGLVYSLKMKTETEMSSISKSIEQLSEQFKTQEAATSKQLTSLQEQVVKLQELSTKQENLITELKEQLCICEAKQQAEGEQNLELPALKQKIDNLLNIVAPVPQMDLNDSITQPTVQMRRRDSRKRSSTKRASRPVSGISDSSILRSNSMSSTTSSGYRSGNISHQDSTESQSLLASIREQESASDLTTATPNPTTSTPCTDNTQQEDVDQPTDLEALRSTLVETLYQMGDLLDIFSTLTPSIINQDNSQPDVCILNS